MLKEEYMIAKKAAESVEQAVCYELQNIVKKYGATYHSEHEAYAVLLEEKEETQDALESLELTMGIIWNNIKANNSSLTYIYEAKERAIAIAEEAVQCAAVLERFLSTVGGEDYDRN